MQISTVKQHTVEYPQLDVLRRLFADHPKSFRKCMGVIIGLIIKTVGLDACLSLQVSTCNERAWKIDLAFSSESRVQNNVHFWRAIKDLIGLIAYRRTLPRKLYACGVLTPAKHLAKLRFAVLF